MFKIDTKLTAALAICGAALFFAGKAEAATVSCVAPVDSDLSGYNAGCEYFSPNVMGTLDVTDMNSNSALGETTWALIGKVNIGNPNTTEGDASAITSAGAAGGTYSLAAALFAIYDKIAIGFKDGNNPGVQPSNAVVYGFTSAASGSFVSMFYQGCDGSVAGDCTDADRKGGADGAISNITVWGIKKGDPPGGVIPLPAGLPLLLSALGIGGLVARRKRKAA